MRIVLDINIADRQDVEEAFAIITSVREGLLSTDTLSDIEEAKARAVEATMPVQQPVELQGRDVQPEQQQAPVPAKAPLSEDIAAAVRAYATANGLEKTRGLLAKFGATRASDVSPNVYGEFLKEAAV